MFIAGSAGVPPRACYADISARLAMCSEQRLFEERQDSGAMRVA